MKKAELLAELKQWGFKTPVVGSGYRASVKEFQRAMGLKVDGILGPKTTAAMTAVRESGGKLSMHFSVGEFRCKGRNCCGGRVRVTRAHILNLETLRTKKLPRGVIIVSGYRCPEHNRKVGGASKSRHLKGDATDLRGELTYDEVKRLKLFGGIGTKGGMVTHVDSRYVSDKGRPVHWTYDA